MGGCGSKESSPSRKKVVKHVLKDKDLADSGRRVSEDATDDSQVYFFPDKELPELQGDGEAKSPCTPNGQFDCPTSALQNIIHNLGECEWEVDVCISRLENANVLEVLTFLVINGHKVRIIIDSTSHAASEQSPLEDLVKAGAEIRDYKGRGGDQMEHQFIIIDNIQVITGAFSWSSEAILKHTSSVVVSAGKKLIGRFKTEFERLWATADPEADTFKTNAKSSMSRVDKTSRVYFLPDWCRGETRRVKGRINHDTAVCHLLQFFTDAKRSICLAVNHIDQDEILKAIAGCASNGISIRIVVDSSSTIHKRPLVAYRKYPNMHESFAIIDDDYVLTGSFAWTMAAATHKLQNCVVHQYQSLMFDYKERFNTLWKAKLTDPV